MSTLQDQMRMDSSWVKPNPASNLTLASRTHGQHYIYNYAPNYGERLEMSMRSLGRQYNWEMEKFRNDKKPADRGNRLRIFKNFFRFVKNPLGYTMWKSMRLMKTHRLWLTMFYVMFPVLFYRGYKESIQNRAYAGFYVAIGDTINGPKGQKVGFYDQIRPPSFNIYNCGLITVLQPRNYVANPTYKMNYKKHEETLNRNKEQILNYFKADNIFDAHAINFGFK